MFCVCIYRHGNIHVSACEFMYTYSLNLKLIIQVHGSSSMDLKKYCKNLKNATNNHSNSST